MPRQTGGEESMSDETMRTPWMQDEFENVHDAGGVRVTLVGFALACGYVRDGDPCREVTRRTICAVNAYEPMRALLQKCATALHTATMNHWGRTGVGLRDHEQDCSECRPVYALLADLRAAGVEPEP